MKGNIPIDFIKKEIKEHESESSAKAYCSSLRILLNRWEEKVETIPVWYIIRWYEKRYKLGSTVADDWERGFLKEKIAEMHDDFKNKKYLDNKQELERFAQMVKEVIDLYNDWEKENEN